MSNSYDFEVISRFMEFVKIYNEQKHLYNNENALAFCYKCRERTEIQIWNEVTMEMICKCKTLDIFKIYK